jgi:hypothetical protein
MSPSCGAPERPMNTGIPLGGAELGSGPNFVSPGCKANRQPRTAPVRQCSGDERAQDPKRTGDDRGRSSRKPCERTTRIPADVSRSVHQVYNYANTQLRRLEDADVLEQSSIGQSDAPVRGDAEVASCDGRRVGGFEWVSRASKLLRTGDRTCDARALCERARGAYGRSAIWRTILPWRFWLLVRSNALRASLSGNTWSIVGRSRPFSASVASCASCAPLGSTTK